MVASDARSCHPLNPPAARRVGALRSLLQGCGIQARGDDSGLGFDSPTPTRTRLGMCGSVCGLVANRRQGDTLPGSPTSATGSIAMVVGRTCVRHRDVFPGGCNRPVCRISQQHRAGGAQRRWKARRPSRTLRHRRCRRVRRDRLGGGADPDPGHAGQDPNHWPKGPTPHHRPWILDINGTRYVIGRITFPDTSQQHLDDPDTILNSIQIDVVRGRQPGDEDAVDTSDASSTSSVQV
jgi:hypothetical protein